MKPRRHSVQPRQTRTALLAAAGVVAFLLLATSLYLSVIGAGGGARPRADTIGGPFALVRGDGQKVTDRSFAGKYLLIYFGYTSCPDVCPTTLTALAGALDALGAGAAKVQPLFITLDPWRDTPPVADRYARAFTPLLIGLSGAPEDIRRVVDEYRVTSAIQRDDHDPGAYALEHSAVLYLMAPDGRFIAPIKATESSAAMARAIARYLS
jgi:protein SCO1/2